MFLSEQLKEQYFNFCYDLYCFKYDVNPETDKEEIKEKAEKKYLLDPIFRSACMRLYSSALVEESHICTGPLPF